MYLDEIKETFLQQKLAYSASNIFPCSETEVKLLENKVIIKLPKAYREFLLWGGNGAGWFMEGSDFYYESLSPIQQIAREMLEEDKSPDKLLDDAFVFWMHQGYMFSFFHTSEGDNPPIHHYCQGQNDGRILYNKQRSFTRFLEVEIESHARWRDGAGEEPR